MNETQLQIYCNGHHERMRGTPRQEAPETLREFWLDGWDSADGELYDRAISGIGSCRGWVNAEAKS